MNIATVMPQPNSQIDFMKAERGKPVDVPEMNENIKAAEQALHETVRVILDHGITTQNGVLSRGPNPECDAAADNASQAFMDSIHSYNIELQGGDQGNMNRSLRSFVYEASLLAEDRQRASDKGNAIDPKIEKNRLENMKYCLDKAKKRNEGLDDGYKGSLKVRQWDNCHRIDSKASGVPAQVSLTLKGRHLK